MSKKYYAVKKGLTCGIYTDWESCKAQVDGFPKAEYKGFKTISEAEKWLGIASGSAEHPAIDENDIPCPPEGSAIAYVDGSFSEAAGRFSYGVVFFAGGKELHFSKSFDHPELLEMRNVAGEIMGSGQAMKAAKKLGLQKIVIYHDYEGIAKWCTGEWKTNKSWTKAYKKFYDEISQDLSVEFVKVKAHSKNKYNDLADELAKKALEET